MSFIHPFVYLAGGSPASTPLVWFWCWRAPKTQDYQATTPLSLSTLRT